MSKPEDELEPVDSLPAVIGDFSQDSKLSPPNGDIKSGTTLSDILGNRFAIGAGCIIGVVGLVGCYSLKYFVRRSNVRTKRLWLGAYTSFAAYSCFLDDFEGRLLAKRVENEDNQLQHLYAFSVWCRVIFAQVPWPSNDARNVSAYWHLREQLNFDSTLTRRILHRVRGLWYNERSYMMSCSLLVEPLKTHIENGGKWPNTDFDLCMAHVATCISAKIYPDTVTGLVMQSLSGYALTASVIVRLFSHRFWLSRISTICGMSSGATWFTLDHLRRYYIFDEPYKIQDKVVITDLLRNLEGSDPKWLHRKLGLD